MVQKQWLHVIAFIAAEIQEFIGLRRHLKNERSLDSKCQWSVTGELDGRPAVLAVNGPGPRLARQAAQAIEENRRLDALISYGFCGALDPALGVNDVVVASGVECGAGILACHLAQRQAGMPPPQRLISTDHVVGTAREKAELRKSGAGVVEMEAAGVASHAQQRGIPFYCIRVVTDSASEEFPIDFNRVRDAEGRFSRLKIMARAARNPLKLVPELIQLNKRIKAAAHELGDFVATCEF